MWKNPHDLSERVFRILIEYRISTGREPYTDEYIRRYLFEQFNLFMLCRNTVDDIIWAIDTYYSLLSRDIKHSLAGRKSYRICEALVRKGYSISSLLKEQLGNKQITTVVYLIRKGYVLQWHYDKIIKKRCNSDELKIIDQCRS